jgi:hypothetical protein
MKKLNKFKIIALFAFLGLLNGCQKDQLDLKNLSAYNPEDIWNSVATAQYYVNNCYAFTLGGGWSTSQFWSDEDSNYLLEGAVTSQNGTQKFWPYGNIRRINIGLEEVEKGTLTDDQKSLIKGQLYFLRAWLYFGAVAQHGGVPIIKHPQTVDEDLYVSRNSTAECFTFIAEDLDLAIASKIPERGQGADYGKISKAAAKAFKGRVMLWRASPIFNPANYWDNKYWQDAYVVNKAAYEDLKATGIKLVDNYANLWTDVKGSGAENSEFILPKILKYPNSTMGWYERQRRPLSESSGDTGYDQPVWDHVVLYPMLDGKPIGQSTKYPYDINTYFQNRDPRLYKNIYFNGCKAEISGKIGRRQYNTDDIGTLGYPNAFVDFVRKPGLTRDWNRTGFFPKKGIMEANDLNNIEYNDTDFAFLRFAEVILNYAEAANEVGKQGEAIAVLSELRQRAGIESGGDYGLSGYDRVKFRRIVQDERAIELYQEGQRLSSMRRWRRISEWDNKPWTILYARVKEEFWTDATHTALVPGKNPALFQLLPEDFTYETMLFESSTGLKVQRMPDSYIIFPIQRAHLELNKNLKQNTGWDGGTFDPSMTN